MSYLAIARKYRPGSFAEMVGQEHVTRTLGNAIRRGRIHHAFLFTGARGVGKTTAARALAKALNCVNGPTPEPCGTCASCVEISQGRSPDLIEIDGASNNSVDDVRELRDAVQYAPTRKGYKIYLIDEVHMLSKGAFNALLKTLEEPPPHVVFLFATTEPNRIPETILSRVQRFDFKRIPPAAVVERLGDIARSEGVTLSPHALRLIARAGEGSMRDAQSLLDQVIASGGPEFADQEVADLLGLVDRSLVHAVVDGLLRAEPSKALDAIETVYGYGYDLSEFAGEILETVRNATFLRLSERSRAHLDLPQDEVAALDALVQGVDPAALTRVFDVLVDVIDQMAHSGRPRLVLEMAVARLATTRPVLPVGALVERLESLQRDLRRDGARPRPAPLRGGDPGPIGDAAVHPPPAVRPEPAAPRLPEPPPAAARPAAPRPGATQPARAPGGPAPEPSRPAPSRPPESRPATPRPAAESSRAASPATRDAGPSSAWDQLAARLRRIDGAVPIAAGLPRRSGNKLVVTVIGGRESAEARRIARNPEIRDAVAATYGDGVTLEIEMGEAPKDDDASRLRAAALGDPTVRAAIERLGAQLLDVRPSSDDSN